MSDRRASNSGYYERTRDRLILRESELRPTTILELIDCLRDLPPHPADKRIARLEDLYRASPATSRPPRIAPACRAVMAKTDTTPTKATKPRTRGKSRGGKGRQECASGAYEPQ
jgi:hypothetical protein